MLLPHSTRAAALRVDLADAPCVNGERRPLELFLFRCLKLQRTVRAMAVVMADVDLEDALEVATGEDRQPVQALGPDRSDPSLAEGVDTRCPDGSADDLEPLDHEHLIERTAELGVAVMDEKPQRIFSFVEVKREVSRLLGHPSSGLAVQPVRCTRLVASSMNTGT
jgi:hypothetical protein